MNPHLDFLLSDIYKNASLHPEHAADLAKSGITVDTIILQKIRTVMPPSSFDDLLGFRVPAAVTSMYVTPYFSPDRTLTSHTRVKVFPAITTNSGTIKYLQRKRSGVRPYFPLATLDAVLNSDEPLLIAEGEKKALSIAQLGLPVVGVAGIEGWHLAGSRDLHPDFDVIPLDGRVVDVVPDGDVHTNVAVARGARRLADALRAAGARPRLVRLPQTIAA